MNAQFVGRRDVAPRGHPNDGRFETVEVDRSMSIRQRAIARRRLPRGEHVPHPRISVRSFESWNSERRSVLWIDGVRVGAVDHCAVEIRPDARSVWIPSRA
jgi:hypothetical protein